MVPPLNYNGYLYEDNLEYARSTSVYHNGTDFVPSSSGMSNTNITVELGGMLSNTTPTESTDQDRSVDNRIRAVYRSGTR